MKKYLFIAILIPFLQIVKAQRHEIYSPRIATLQVIGGIRWMQLPLIRLNDNEVMNISFDDLTHEYHRYTYTIEHCEADWTTSEELFSSEFIDGFAEGNVIEDIEQ